MKIVVKVGTSSLLNKSGAPCKVRMKSLVGQVSNLKIKGHQVVLVSSGSVPFGKISSKGILREDYGKSLGERQVLSAVGQHRMLEAYSSLFGEKGITTCQLLLIKKDFDTRDSYLNISRLLRELLVLDELIPIANENDSVSTRKETVFSDNDELAGLIAAQINADKLVIISDCGGLYTEDPSLPSAKLIKVVDPKTSVSPKISASKSKSGTGGMATKIKVATEVAKLGIMTHISSLDEKSVLEKLVKGEDLGTKILPSSRRSAMKRWIALSAEKSKGEVVIDRRLLEIFSREVVSILPVGIVKCVGDFRKGDLVLVLDEKGKPVCVGMARYESEKVRSFMGLHNKPEFIHRDYLHVL